MADEVSEDVSEDIPSDLEILDSVISDKPASEKEEEESVEESLDEPEQEQEEEKEEEVEAKDEDQPEDPLIFRKIKEIAPDLFKKVPELKSIIGKERQYAEVFATPVEAKEAAEKVQAFADLSDKILSGDSNAFFKELAESDEGAYEKFTENILPTIRKAHPEMFVKIITPHVKQILVGLSNIAAQTKNNDLRLSVGHIAKQLWGDPNVKLDEPKDDAFENERKRLESERRDFQNKQLNDFDARTIKDLDTRMTGMLTKAIDPENALPAKLRTAMIQDAVKEIQSIVEKDGAHRTRIQSLRRQAQQEGYTGEASERLISTVLARVKPLVSSVRQKVVSEYKAEKQQAANKGGKKFIPSSASVGAQKGKKVDYSKMSDLELLDS